MHSGFDVAGVFLTYPPKRSVGLLRYGWLPKQRDLLLSRHGSRYVFPCQLLERTSRMSLSMDFGTAITAQGTPAFWHSRWMASAPALPPLPPTTNTMSSAHMSIRLTISLMSAPPLPDHNSPHLSALSSQVNAKCMVQLHAIVCHCLVIFLANVVTSK